LVALAGVAGIAAQVHAIGDGAVRTSLAALEAAPRLPLMPRIEHAQLVDPADMPRFAASGIAACVMPRDIRADKANSLRFWGRDRTEHGAYAFGSLARSGAVVVFGTDAPVESPDPWPAIVSAVTRRAPAWAPADAFVPDEAMPLERALRAACLDAALAAGERDRGRLAPGHRADLVVIPSAALEEPVDPDGPLETVRPELVLVDGRVAFER
jgi:predicted amidohydrolase YtcJ